MRWCFAACLLLLLLETSMAFSPGDVITVAGASGRVGVRAVESILRRFPEASIRAVVRDASKAKRVLPPDERIAIIQADLRDATGIAQAVDGCKALLWTATGFSDNSEPLQRIANLASFLISPKNVIDRVGVESAASRLAAATAAEPTSTPRFVLLSSAAVTRPAWSKEEKAAFPEAATIPIVKLNPFGILDLKREGEDGLRRSGVPYAIVRACGLNDRAPPGRPVFTVGDVASGRINRSDVADVMVRLLAEDSATGKTFEVFSIPALDETAKGPRPPPLGPALRRLPTDAAIAATGPAEALAMRKATYTVLAQLPPSVSVPEKA